MASDLVELQIAQRSPWDELELQVSETFIFNHRRLYWYLRRSFKSVHESRKVVKYEISKNALEKSHVRNYVVTYGIPIGRH